MRYKLINTKTGEPVAFLESIYDAVSTAKGVEHLSANRNRPGEPDLHVAIVDTWSGYVLS